MQRVCRKTWRKNLERIILEEILSDKFNFSNKLNDILIKYDSFPATFRNQINELSYIQNSFPVYINSNLNNLSYELSKESVTNSNNLNDLSYNLSKESTTNTNNLNNLSTKDKFIAIAIGGAGFGAGAALVADAEDIGTFGDLLKQEFVTTLLQRILTLLTTFFVCIIKTFLCE